MTNLTHVKGQILIFILQTFFQIFSFLQKIFAYWFILILLVTLFRTFWNFHFTNFFHFFFTKKIFHLGFLVQFYSWHFLVWESFLSFFHFAKFFHLGLVWKVDLYLYHERFVTHYKYLTFVMCEIRHTLFTTHYICVWPLSCRIWQRLDMTKARYMYYMIWPLSCHT